jgi:hypothetical protein
MNVAFGRGLKFVEGPEKSPIFVDRVRIGWCTQVQKEFMAVVPLQRVRVPFISYSFILSAIERRSGFLRAKLSGLCFGMHSSAFFSV